MATKIAPLLGKDWKDIKPVPVSYNRRDLILYAIGIGCNEMRFVYENDSDFDIFPTYPIVLTFKGNDQDVVSFPSPAMVDSNSLPALSGVRVGLDGERLMEFLHPLPKDGGNFFIKTRLVSCLKKGKGAAVETETILTDKAGKVFVRIVSSAFLVGATDFEGAGTSLLPSVDTPKRSADATEEFKTDINQTQIYRLSGDYNPLHVDPGFALAMGFKAPILHGLCSYGIATRAVLKHFGDNNPQTVKQVKARFVKPVLPGQTLVTSMWKEGNKIIFEVKVKETGDVVVSNAFVETKGPSAKL